MKTILTKNAWHIFELSTKYTQDLSVAPDMFCADCLHAPTHPVDGVDYDAIHKECKGETWSTLTSARVDFSNLIHDHYEELCKAYSIGDKVTFRSIVESWEAR